MVVASKNHRDRDAAQQEAVCGDRDLQPEQARAQVIEDRRRGDKAAGLPDRRLKQRDRQHVPQRPLAPGGGVGRHHALARGVGKPERHFEPVVFRHISQRDAPQQRVLESAACRGRRDKMTRADPRHHENHAGAKLAHQTY